MSLSEIEHPIAQELATILHASEAGLAASNTIPEHVSFDYYAPTETVNSAAKIVFADAETENVGVISIPVFTSHDSPLRIQDDNGLQLTSARIKIADVNREQFGLNNGEVLVDCLQFDITPKSVIFSAEIWAPVDMWGQKLVCDGEYESEGYDSWANMMRMQGSFATLHTAAIRFLS